MREQKYRVWDNVNYMSTPFTFKDLQEKKIQFTDDCEVMQFTGLKDRNGKDIYEGDILKSNKNDFYIHGDKADVYFLNGSFCVSMEYDLIPMQLYDFDKVYKPSDYPNNTDKSDWIEEFEIIGNIHENPEFL